MPDPSPHILVVGAGPCGLAVGAAARRAGITATLFDEGPLCASLVAYPPYMSFFSTAEKLEIEGVPFTSARPHPSRREALAYYRGIARYFRMDIRLYRRVLAIERADGRFRVSTRGPAGDRESFVGDAVVVATGGFHEPNLIGVPGEELPKVSHHFEEAHPYWDQDVLIVGGGNSAVEGALELFRTGARVAMAHFGEDFDRGVKSWLLPDIRNRLAAGEIRMYWRHRVAAIHPTEVVLREEGTGVLQQLANDWVLALTGWRPDHALLRALGVPSDEASGVPLHDADTMHTPVSGVYVAGVLTAGYDANRIFIENGREHGGRIVAHLLDSR